MFNSQKEQKENLRFSRSVHLLRYFVKSLKLIKP